MVEILKNRYNAAYVARLARILKECRPAFPEARFQERVFDDRWAARELKDRMRHLAECLGVFLPKTPAAYVVLKEAAPSFGGFEAMFFPEFVALFGLEQWDSAMDALEWFTRYSSSEFAIRPFILRYPQKTMARMTTWARHDNKHLRRLASEGCRPRLPWAMALPAFKRDPSPILPILEILKDDPQDYVRRSVANNLNDISKDHPELVLDLAVDWQGRDTDTAWILKHACRTLLKAGHPRAMALFGFGDTTSCKVENLTVSPAVLPIGGRTGFSFRLRCVEGPPCRVRLEYAIDFVKASGKTSRKIFQISEKSYKGGSVTSISKLHAFKNLSTRKHYPGSHGLAIKVNGVQVAEVSFQLQADRDDLPTSTRQPSGKIRR